MTWDLHDKASHRSEIRTTHTKLKVPTNLRSIPCPWNERQLENGPPSLRCNVNKTRESRCTAPVTIRLIRYPQTTLGQRTPSKDNTYPLRVQKWPTRQQKKPATASNWRRFGVLDVRERTVQLRHSSVNQQNLPATQKNAGYPESTGEVELYESLWSCRW